MHEVHLVRAIVETVEKLASARKAPSVTRVGIRFNALTSHSADHVRFAFDLVKKDSRLLKNTELTLTEVEPTLHCSQCHHTFRGEHLPEACPKCGSLNVMPVNSTDLVLEGFETGR